MDTSTQAYIDRIHDVPGFVTPFDATLLAHVAEVQAGAGVDGDLLEIGCWYGRTAILLGFLAGRDESLHVCDLFSGTPPTEAGRREAAASSVPLPSRPDFEKWYRRFHADDPVIHEGPSTALSTSELGSGRFRLIHVDGSHVYDVVQRDIDLARELARKGGVVVFDDYANIGHLGVAAALWPALRRDELEPFACSPSKLYAAVGSGYAAEYRRAVQQFAAVSGADAYECELPEGTIVTVSGDPARIRLRARVLARARRILRQTRMTAAATALAIEEKTGVLSLALCA